ncbi:unnamed protein product, partial [marine sediment metagenome]
MPFASDLQLFQTVLSAQGFSGLPSKSKLKTSPFNKKETFPPVVEGSA